MVVDTAIRFSAFALALTPAAAIAFYVWARRTHSIGLEFIVVAVGLGASVGLLAAGVEVLLTWAAANLVNNVHLISLIDAFVVAAMTEEMVKFSVLIFVVMGHEDCRTPRDVFCGAIFVGLGFAALENVFYVVGETDWRQIGLLRSFTAVPGHAIFGILMGYYAALATKHEAFRRRYLAMGLLVAVLFHGLYNWPLLALPNVTEHGLIVLALWVVFCLVLIAGGVIAIRCLESARFDRPDSEPVGVALLWRPSLLFWRIAGLAIMSIGLAAPLFGYVWQAGGLAGTLIMIPVGILPVIFGYSLFRFGADKTAGVGRRYRVEEAGSGPASSQTLL